MALVFDFKNANEKSWFRNNLGKLLQKRLEIRLVGEKVYDNGGESLMEVYKICGWTKNNVPIRSKTELRPKPSARKSPRTTKPMPMPMPPHCSVSSERNRE
ncbi:Hypothetical predicted protein [Paramuricea clavata]|uniref:Uncharacterized protein n=1 Tax=Paramuricea clavata TaxID=317549 RepID=A0A7D9I0Z7_PARCT|nr:Hypothetical predicted protein [Paramuricea clavata]